MPEDSPTTEPLRKLRALLGAIVPANRFYAPRLARAGVDADVASLADFSARMPFTTKADIAADQAAHPPFGTNLTFPLERYTRFCRTSGTSAAPLAILDTPESWEWMLGNWLAILHAAEVRAADRIFFAFSFGPFLGFWTAFEAAAKLGCLCLPGGGLSSAARVRMLIDNGATVLCCTPTYALRLAEVAAEEGIDLRESAVRKIFVAGEPGGSVPGVRARLRERWNGAEIFDHHGMTETGPVTVQLPGEGHLLRVIESAYFAEIVAPESGAPTPPGEIGELVLTPLGRTAWPLLRYRTGDLVRRDPDAAGFALAGGIIGRTDDMIVVRGVNLYPSAVDAVVRSVPEIGEYRVRVSRRDALAEVRLEVESASAAAASELQSALAAAFSLRIPVALAPPGTLPRFEMKAKRWVTTD